jgi:hypothetical protein
MAATANTIAGLSTRTGHQHLQEQGFASTAVRRAAGVPVAAGEQVQQQAGPGKRGQPEQGQRRQ